MQDTGNIKLSNYKGWIYYEKNIEILVIVILVICIIASIIIRYYYDQGLISNTTALALNQIVGVPKDVVIIYSIIMYFKKKK